MVCPYGQRHDRMIRWEVALRHKLDGNWMDMWCRAILPTGPQPFGMTTCASWSWAHVIDALGLLSDLGEPGPV